MFFRDIAFYWMPSKRKSIDATLLDHRSRDTFLEFMFVIAIVGILTALAASNLHLFTSKVQMLEAVSLIGTYRADAIAYRAATGRFPDKLLHGETSSEFFGHVFRRAQWRDDELVLSLSDRALERMGYASNATMSTDNSVTLGFRVAVNPENGGLAWICGEKEAPAGFNAPDEQHTNVPSKFLPHFCRSSVPD